MYSNMKELWNYLESVKLEKTKYKLGKFGQRDIDGYLMYDCVCLIKSFAWCSGVAGAAPIYKGNGVLDDWIGYIYSKASKKGNMRTLPKEGICLVYLNNEHIGVYNASTQTVIECCAGNTMKVVERDVHYYDNTKYAWNKWSNLYWCADNDTIDIDYYRVQIGSFEVWDNAVRLARRLNELGYSVLIKQYNEFYRVQVGAYEDYINATYMVDKMHSLGFSDAYIPVNEGGKDVRFFE